jgi:hypothetical protein
MQRSDWGRVALTVCCGATFALADAPHPGVVDPAAIARVVAAHQAETAACFEAQRTWSPQLSGTLVYDFELEADGTVGAACRGDGSTFTPALQPEAVDALTVCIGRAVRTWRFPAPRGGAADVSWPFSFTARPPLR